MSAKVFAASDGVFYSPESSIPTERLKLELWHDLKPISSYESLPDSIKDTINTYHSLSKTDRKVLQHRIDALQNIIHNLNELGPAPALRLLYQTACNKMLYLIGLAEQQPFFKALKLERIPESGKFRSGLGIRKHYVDNETIVHLDPAFRTGKVFEEVIAEWKILIETTVGIPDFYMWLEIQPERPFEVEEAVIKYNLVGPDLIKARRVYFDEEGCAYNVLYGNKTLSSKIFDGVTAWPLKIPQDDPVGSNFLYNIDLDGNLYIGTLIDTPKHSYILRGKLVNCAGYIVFNNEGFITKIDTNSGHYQPSPQQFTESLNLLIGKNSPLILSKSEFQFHDGVTGLISVSHLRQIPDIKKSIKLAGIELLSLKKYLSPEDLELSIADPSIYGKTILLKDLLLQLENNQAAYKELNARLKEKKEFLDNISYEFEDPEALEVLLKILKHHFLYQIEWIFRPYKEILSEDVSTPQGYYHTFLKPVMKTLQEAASVEGFIRALPPLCKHTDEFSRILPDRRHQLFAIFEWIYSANGLNCQGVPKLLDHSGEGIEHLLKTYEKAKVHHYVEIEELNKLNRVKINGASYSLKDALDHYSSSRDEYRDLLNHPINILFRQPLSLPSTIINKLRIKANEYNAPYLLKQSMKRFKARKEQKIQSSGNTETAL